MEKIFALEQNNFATVEKYFATVEKCFSSRGKFVLHLAPSNRLKKAGRRRLAWPKRMTYFPSKIG